MRTPEHWRLTRQAEAALSENVRVREHTAGAEPKQQRCESRPHAVRSLAGNLVQVLKHWIGVLPLPLKDVCDGQLRTCQARQA